MRAEMYKNITELLQRYIGNDYDKNKCLLKACEDGYYDGAVAFIEDGANANYVEISDYGKTQTPLQTVCSSDKFSDQERFLLVRLLLYRGADPNYECSIPRLTFHIPLLGPDGKPPPDYKDKPPTVNSVAHVAPLNTATKKGYEKIIEILLKAGATVDVEIEKIFVHPEEKALNIIKLLIEKRVDVKNRDKFLNTLLCTAVQQCSLLIVKYLIIKGANPNSNDFLLKLALKKYMSGTEKEKYKLIIESLVQAGATVSLFDDSENPLYQAIKKADDEAVKFLLNKDLDLNKCFDLNKLNNDGLSTLGLALVELHNRKNTTSVLGIFFSKPLPSENIVSILLDAGASPLIKQQGKDLLRFARENEASQNVISLIEESLKKIYDTLQFYHDKALKFFDKEEYNTVLSCYKAMRSIAPDHEQVKEIENLLKEINSNKENTMQNDKQVLLLNDQQILSLNQLMIVENFDQLMAADWKDIKLIAALRNQEQAIWGSIISNLNPQELWRKDQKGNHGLHIAALFGNEEAIQLYVQKNLINDDLNDFKLSPLHLAVMNGKTTVVELLLNNGASPLKLCQVKASQEKTITHLSALTLAVLAGHDTVISSIYQILKRKSKHNEDTLVNCSLGNILHVAIVSRLGNILEFLLTDKDLRDWALSFLSSPNKDGLTPLAFAAYVGNVDAIKMLKKAGADINEQNNQYERTALHYAVIGLQQHSVECLIQLNADVMLSSKEPSSETDKLKTPLQLANKINDTSGKLRTIKTQLQNVQRVRERSHGFRRESEITYRILIAQGGGAKGVFYPYALPVLKSALSGLDIISGTSAGAITALFLAMNFSYEALEDALKKLTVQQLLGDKAEDFEHIKAAQDSVQVWWKTCKENLKSDSRTKKGKGVVQTMGGLFSHLPDFFQFIKLFTTLINKTALSDGKALETWIKGMVANKLRADMPKAKYSSLEIDQYIDNFTFGRLHDLTKRNLGYKQLYVFSINISNQQIFDFNSVDERWKRVNAIEATCASATLPFVFAPRLINFPSAADPTIQDKGYFIDGGLLRNKPFEYFNRIDFQDPFIDQLLRWQQRTNQELIALCLEVSGYSLLTISESKPLTEKQKIPNTFVLSNAKNIWRLFIVNDKGELDPLEIDKISGLKDLLENFGNKEATSISKRELIPVKKTITAWKRQEMEKEIDKIVDKLHKADPKKINTKDLLVKIGQIFYNAEIMIQDMSKDIIDRSIIFDVGNLATTDFDIVEDESRLEEIKAWSQGYAEEFLARKGRLIVDEKKETSEEKSKTEYSGAALAGKEFGKISKNDNNNPKLDDKKENMEFGGVTLQRP